MDTIILESFSQAAGKRYSQEMGNRFCKGYLYKGGTCIQYIYLFSREKNIQEVYGEKNDIVQPVRYQFNAAPLTEQGGSYKY